MWRESSNHPIIFSKPESIRPHVYDCNHDDGDGRPGAATGARVGRLNSPFMVCFKAAVYAQLSSFIGSYTGIHAGAGGIMCTNI